VYLAFPDGAPYIYVSLAAITPATTDKTGTSMREIILSAIPKVFSKPQERYMLRPTAMSVKDLSALLAVRGGGKGNNAQGGWSIYVDGDVDQSPLDPQARAKVDIDGDEKTDGSPGKENRTQDLPIIQKKRPGTSNEENSLIAKRRKLLAESRFGQSARPNDGKGLDRFDVRIEDAFPALPDIAESPEPVETWHPTIRITFLGSHVFAGIRRLVENGIVDGNKLPGWMTGEEAVSVGVVKNGRIIGKQRVHNV
jgi:central kinetochore subunit Mis15/CHL4